MNNKSKKIVKQTKDENFSSTKKRKNSQEELQENGQNTNNINRNIIKDSKEQPNKSGADDIEKQNSELNDEIENLRDEKLRLLAELRYSRKIIKSISNYKDIKCDANNLPTLPYFLDSNRIRIIFNLPVLEI